MGSVLVDLREALLTEEEIPFKVGDEVLFGKYKNKKGKIVSFGRNPKGQVTVEIEPIPKGRKKNREMGLFKIWTAKQAKAEMKAKLREIGPPDEWSGAVAASLGEEGRFAFRNAWDQLPPREREALRKAWKKVPQPLGKNMVADGTDEAAPKRTRRRIAGKGTKRLSKRCPTGMNIKGGRCVRVPSSKRARRKRLKKKWRRGGKGRKSAKRSKRFAKRFSHVEHLIEEGRRLLEEG